MAAKKQYTKEQHYIPQMILKNFTHFHAPMRKPMIYQYDKITNKEKLADIRKVCKKKNLYELKDEAGNISASERNIIENNFSVLEKEWNRIICKIIRQEYLSDDDKCYLWLLLGLQLLRTPEIINFTELWTFEVASKRIENLSKCASDRYSKITSFMCGEVSPDNNWILSSILECILEEKQIVIYQSTTPFILNGSRPVLCIKLFPSAANSSAQWFFPVSPNLCLASVNAEAGTPEYIKISDDITNFINLNSFKNDSRYIYSSNPIRQQGRQDD